MTKPTKEPEILDLERGDDGVYRLWKLDKITLIVCLAMFLFLFARAGVFSPDGVIAQFYRNVVGIVSGTAYDHTGERIKRMKREAEILRQENN